MPIYAYRCETCGFQQDVLQKMSDPLLVVCPSCGASTFRKQVTAAGFQLKGSGWYVTDFRNPATKDAPKAKAGDAAEGGKSEGGSSDAGKSDAGKGDAGKADQSASSGDKPAPVTAPAPAPASSDTKPAPAPGGGSSS